MPEKKPAPPGRVSRFSPSRARRCLKLLCRLELENVRASCQLVKVVGPSLNLQKPLLDVLCAVVAGAVRVLLGVGKVHLDHRSVDVQLANQHCSGACP